MTRRPKLQWWVPYSEYEAFRSFVEREYGDFKGYVGREAERAMREFADADEWATVEERVDGLVRAAGRTPAALAGKKEKSGRTPPGGSTTKVKWRVAREVKERFASTATRDYPDETYGVVLARALRVRRDGGRAARVQRKLERVQDDAETLLAEMNEDSDGGPDKAERVEMAIARHLGDQFSEADLADAIDAETSGSDYYHDRYGPRVIKKKGVKRLARDDEPDMFLQPEPWWERRTTEIIRALGGTQEPRDDGGVAWTLSSPFTRVEFLRAANNVGVDTSDANREAVNDYRQRVCDRLDFQWDDAAEQFVPRADAGAEDATPGVDAGEPTEQDDVDAELDRLTEQATRGDGDGGGGRR